MVHPGARPRRVGGVGGTSPVCRGLPVTGTAIVDPAPSRAPARSGPSGGDGASLARLLGRNGATILTLLDAPLSTTHLMGLTDLPARSVSTHLRVLFDSGLVQRRRSGREVLYWRSALGETLAGAAGGARLTEHLPPRSRRP